MAQQVKNLTSIHEEVGLIPGLSQWIKGSSIAARCCVGCRCGLDLALLWLCHMLAADLTLSRGTSRCHGCDPEKKKKKKKEESIYMDARNDAETS